MRHRLRCNTDVRAFGDYRHKLMGYRDDNLRFALRNPNEEWMWLKLIATPFFWQRQGLWAYRMFDFWCPDEGVAIEVDGPEHDTVRDALRDAFALKKAGIIVFRVRNRDESDARDAIASMYLPRPVWRERRRAIMRLQGAPPERGQFIVKARNDFRHLPEKPVWAMERRVLFVPSTGQIVRTMPPPKRAKRDRKSGYVQLIKNLDAKIDEREIPW